jgi:hypothetical protein
MENLTTLHTLRGLVDTFSNQLKSLRLKSRPSKSKKIVKKIKFNRYISILLQPIDIKPSKKENLCEKCLQIR